MFLLACKMVAASSVSPPEVCVHALTMYEWKIKPDDETPKKKQAVNRLSIEY